jgi:hypothetical protein
MLSNESPGVPNNSRKADDGEESQIDFKKADFKVRVVIGRAKVDLWPITKPDGNGRKKEHSVDEGKSSGNGEYVTQFCHHTFLLLYHFSESRGC